MTWRVHLSFAALASSLAVLLYVGLGCKRDTPGSQAPATESKAAGSPTRGDGKAPPAAPANACTKDTDCTGNNVCEQGKCVPIR